MQERSGAYLLEEATVGPFIATAGVRFDRYEDTSDASVFKDQKATWRAGLVWRARPDVSVYGQWAQSYEPQSVSSQDPLAGGPFAPTEGEIVEGGVKTGLDLLRAGRWGTERLLPRLLLILFGALLSFSLALAHPLLRLPQ